MLINLQAVITLANAIHSALKLGAVVWYSINLSQ